MVEKGKEMNAVRMLVFLLTFGTLAAGPANLVEALRIKTTRMAWFVAHRMPDPGPWWGMAFSDYLVGELQSENRIVYRHPRHPNAEVILSDLRLANLSEFEWGPETVLSSEVQERFTEPLFIDSGVAYDDTVTHTFSKTRTLLEAAKVGAEAAFKVYAEVGGAAMGAKAGAEATAKVSAEYSRQWGTSETVTDTISRHISIRGPWRGVYEAVRSVDKVRRTISTRAGFEATIEIRADGRRLCGWVSFAEFLAVAQGLAPSDRDLYRQFMDSKLSEAQVRSLGSPKPPLVQWTADYDNVLYQRIDIRRQP